MSNSETRTVQIRRQVLGLGQRLASVLRRRTRPVLTLRGRTTSSADDPVGEQFQSSRDSGDDGAPSGPFLLLGGQVLWMLPTYLLLTALDLWSLRLYFIVSFIGLLVNRLLFAPVERTRLWWYAVSLVTWICFAVLGYMLYVQIRTAISAPA